MPKFKLTDEGSAASLELDSDTLRFDQLVLASDVPSNLQLD